VLTVTELLQELIRFDTTNPPGNEAACIAFVRGLLEDEGLETQTFEKEAGRCCSTATSTSSPQPARPGRIRPSRAGSRTTGSGVAARST
jgi:acetylornithine deacetylase/succinyl-diaminopimelate desuccinylase-like protein